MAESTVRAPAARPAVELLTDCQIGARQSTIRLGGRVVLTSQSAARNRLVDIWDAVFIRASSIILKGVRIDQKFVIGASLIVTTNKPAERYCGWKYERHYKRIEK